MPILYNVNAHILPSRLQFYSCLLYEIPMHSISQQRDLILINIENYINGQKIQC